MQTDDYPCTCKLEPRAPSSTEETHDRGCPAFVEAPKKKPYSPPHLRELGSVNKVTLASVGAEGRRKPQG